MKNIYLLLLFFVGILISCSDTEIPLAKEPNQNEIKSRSLQTSPEYYYYYKGKKISLNVHPTKRYVVIEQNESTNLMALGIKATQTAYYVNETQRGYIMDVDTAQATTASAFSLASLVKENNIVAIEYVIGDSILTPVSNKFYVKLKKLSDMSLLEKYAKAIGCEVEGSIASDDYWIRLSSNKESKYNSLEASNFIYETGDFDDVDPGFIFKFQPCAAPTDAYYSSQWNMHGLYGIGAEQAWNITKGSTGIVVAVVDQGINEGHPDLTGRIYHKAYNCDAGNNTSACFDSHGTRVAGIIGANHNSIDLAGIAPNVSLMNISSSMTTSRDNLSEELANGINFAWKNGADIINNSWGDHGGQFYDDLHGIVLENAITAALTQGRNGKGCIVVFASGNMEVIDYPAYITADIMVVGATNSNGNVASFSGKGTSLDVVAPGEIVPLLDLSGITTKSGTSYAAPHVSGLAALILSLNSNLTQNQVNTIIKETARNKTWSQSYGWGIVNAARALQVVQGDYSINIAYPGNGSVTYAQQAKFYIPNLPASASVQWSTNSSAATIKSCSNDTVVFDYNFASRTMTDNINATISYCGMTSQHTLPITVTNDPLITNVERMFYYDTATDRVDFKVSCTDPDAVFEWSGSNNLVDFPYANDAMFMDHPNWYKSLMVPNYSMTYNLSVTASNQYGSHTYYFDYTHTPTMNMMKSEEQEEQENQKEEQL